MFEYIINSIIMKIPSIQVYIGDDENKVEPSSTLTAALLENEHTSNMPSTNEGKEEKERFRIQIKRFFESMNDSFYVFLT